MAKFSNETLITALNIYRQLLELIVDEIDRTSSRQSGFISINHSRIKKRYWLIMKKEPNAAAFQRMASQLKKNSRQWDALNIQLDELIAKVEDDIRRSSLTQYRLRKAKQTSEPD